MHGLGEHNGKYRKLGRKLGFFLTLQRKKWEVALTLSEERGHSREGGSLSWSLGSLVNPLGKETMACKEQMAIGQVCQVLSLHISVWWWWW